jgi:hypothetical protein
MAAAASSKPRVFCVPEDASLTASHTHHIPESRMEAPAFHPHHVPEIADAPVAVAAGTGAGAGAGAGAAAPAPLGPFHPNQLDAAEQIIACFRTGATNHVLLTAEVQSGKTGAFNATICQMLSEGLVDRAYILCGSAETALRTQANADARRYNLRHVTDGNLVVLFRQDFKKGHLDVEEGRTLVVVDESHMDEGNEMQLSSFLEKHGLHMAGTTLHMQTHELYIVSVSATPYAEISSKEYEMCFPKKVVKLLPGPGYYGPENYLEDGNLLPTFDILAHPDRFLDLLRTPRYRSKYVLVRINNPETYSCVQEIASANGIPVLEYNGTTQTIAITAAEALTFRRTHRVPSLEDAPSTLTIVLLKQRLRAGKVVPKQHVGFVWEDAAKASTDTLVQGLLGRMSGYDVPETRPHVFLPPSFLNRDEGRVAGYSELERHIIAMETAASDAGTELLPKRGAYLGACGRSNTLADNERTQCPPLRIPGLLPEIARTYGTFTENEIKEYLLRRLCRHGCALVQTHMGLTPDQSDEICSVLMGYRDEGYPVRDVHIRHGRRREDAADGSPRYTQPRYFGELVKAAATGVPPAEHISGGDPINFFVVYNDYPLEGAVAGDVYAIFYTEAKSNLSSLPLSHRIPAPLPCAFTFHDKNVERHAIAGATVTLTGAVRTSPEAFEAQLRTLVSLWRRNRDGDTHAAAVDPCIKSYKSRFWFARTAYETPNWEGGRFAEILGALAAEYRCRFVLKGGAVYPAVFGMESIAWKEA